MDLQDTSLLHDRSFSAAASVYISRGAWETQNRQTFSSISLLGTLGPGGGGGGGGGGTGDFV